MSRGTVDRVIHERGNVSPAIRERVLEVMEELQYERNLIASTLAYNRSLQVGVLIPDPASDPYWEQPQRGVQTALKSVAHYGINVSWWYFDQYDARSFVDRGKELLQQRPQGILLAPVFEKEAAHFMQQCEQLQIPYLQINTFLYEAGAHNLGYIGQDSYQSGVLAARLLALSIKPRSTVAIIHMEKAVANAQHLVEKEKGFRDFFAARPELNTEVIQLNCLPSEQPEKLYANLENSLRAYPRLSGVLVSTSRVYVLAEFFCRPEYEHVVLGGFDLIEKNTNLLLANKIDFLINQNPLKQGYFGLFKIGAYLLKVDRSKGVRNLPLDIVLKENCRYYPDAVDEIRLIV